ncbi:hypothetical protein ABBQ32_004677 [Trebouxia sp. C0010 RCD-2024]
MGFPTYMDEVDAGAPMPFTGKFLKYHLLKDRLKVVVSSPSQAERDAGEQAFLADLQVQLYDINRLFETTAQRITASQTAVQRKQTSRLARHLKLSILAGLTASGKEKRQQADNQLADAAHWCREYAKINAIALRKILEQHDRMLHNSSGQRLLQACWDDTVDGGKGLQSADFLRSPLLDELKALEARVTAEFAINVPSALVVDRLKQLDESNGHTAVGLTGDDHTDTMEGARTGHVHAAAKQDIVRHWLQGSLENVSPSESLRGEQESAFSGQENWSGAPLLSKASMNLKKTKVAVLTDDEVDDADWTCQGCLNILYCPFGLKCGHQLCKICALRSAGFTASLGDPVKLLAGAPEEAKCPECQLPGVFKGVIYLNQVDQMVKERFPVQWLGRQRDDKQRTAILKQIQMDQTWYLQPTPAFSYGL